MIKSRYSYSFKPQGKDRVFITNTIWTTLALLVVGGSGLALQTLVNWHYALEALGIYSQVIALYTLVTAIVCMGLETSVLKFVAENNDKAEVQYSIVTSSLIIILFSSIFVLLLALFVREVFSSIFSSEQIEDGFWRIFPAVPFFSANKMFIAQLNAEQKMKRYSVVRSMRWVLICLFSVLFVLIGKPLSWCFYAYIMGEFLITLYFVFLFMGKWRFNNALYWLKIHIVYGIYGLLMRIISEMNNNIAVLIAGYLLTLKEVGLISFIMTFTKTINLLASSIQTNFNPIFIKTYSRGSFEKLYNQMRKLFKAVYLLSVPLLLFSVFLYYGYTQLLMGSEFDDTLFLYFMVAVGAILCFTFQWCSSMLVLAGKLKEDAIRVVMIVILKIIITFMFTRIWGMYGNLCSYTVIEIFSVTVSFLLIKWVLRIDIMQIALLNRKHYSFIGYAERKD